MSGVASRLKVYHKFLENTNNSNISLLKEYFSKKTTNFLISILRPELGAYGTNIFSTTQEGNVTFSANNFAHGEHVEGTLRTITFHWGADISRGV